MASLNTSPTHKEDNPLRPTLSRDLAHMAVLCPPASAYLIRSWSPLAAAQLQASLLSAPAPMHPAL